MVFKARFVILIVKLFVVATFNAKDGPFLKMKGNFSYDFDLGVYFRRNLRFSEGF